jgi:hypothetical protein
MRKEMVGGNDINKHKRRNVVRVIDCHAMRDACATISADERKSIESEIAHHLHLIVTSRAFGIIRVIVSVRWLAAVAIAAEIGRHDRVVGGQLRCDGIPHHVRVRRAMQQQNRRPLSTDHAVDDGSGAVDVE